MIFGTDFGIVFLGLRQSVYLFAKWLDEFHSQVGDFPESALDQLKRCYAAETISQKRFTLNHENHKSHCCLIACQFANRTICFMGILTSASVSFTKQSSRCVLFVVARSEHVVGALDLRN